MATPFDALTQEALVLPTDQRIALAHQLLNSVEVDPETDAAWEKEIVQRIARSDAGETVAVSATDVFARLQRIAPGQS